MNNRHLERQKDTTIDNTTATIGALVDEIESLESANKNLEERIEELESFNTELMETIRDLDEQISNH